MKVILALSNFKIVGCLMSATYEGVDNPWPEGWKELIDAKVTFDQVDVDLPSNSMGSAFINHFSPKSGVQELRDMLKECAVKALDLEQRRLESLPDQRNAPNPTDLHFKALERCEDAIVTAQRTIETVPND